MDQLTSNNNQSSGFLKQTGAESTAGFTIIEVLVAITIFSIGILAVITMQITGVNGNVRAQYVSEAVNQASARMEMILAADYAAVVDGAGSNAGVAGLGDVVDVVAGTNADGSDTVGVYNIFWNVADAVPAINCKTIRVIVVNTQLQDFVPVSMDFVKVKDL